MALVSLGCPKNLVDSEKMLAILAEGGCVVGAPMEQADVVIVNTCGFLSAARNESLEVIREALEHKNIGRASRVVVAGCLSTRDGNKLYELAPGIDAVIGTNDRESILSAVLGKRRLTRVSPTLAAASPTPARPAAGKPKTKPLAVPDDSGRFRLTARHTAFLRIAEGCSQRCTFCTIPSIRGPLRSKPPQAVLQEARELIADGAVELNVIAQDTTSYGRDLPDGMNLAQLLKQLDALDGVRWLRLMYTYPRRFTDELIDAIAGCSHVTPYVDLPLQHIADPVLRRMGRGVTRKAVDALLDKLRKRVKGIAIRTTFIVGFPGETEADFNELLEFVKDRKFDALGVFEFSPEAGTPAAVMARQIPHAVKARRAQTIMLAQQKIAFAANARKVGKSVTVLVDGMDPAGRCVGRTAAQAPDIDSVCIFRRRRPTGRFITTRVRDWDNYDLIVD